jgi:tetratricopeptide (TPR) repeat protein
MTEEKKAIADFNKAIELEPDFVQAYLSRGRTFASNIDEALRDFSEEKAEADFNKVIELNPNHSQSYIARAQFFLHSTSPVVEKGLADLAKAIELNPIGIEAYFTRIDFYLGAGMYEKALADSTTLIKKSRLGFGYDLRAKSYFGLGKYEQAIADYTSALKFSPDDFTVLEGRAIAYRLIGKIREAEADEQMANML